MALERREVHFSGQVQGVGFRFTTREIARGFVVRGYVQNLPDGRVLLVAEGEGQELDAFVAALRGRMEEYIDDVQVESPRPTGEFTSFDIRR